MKKRLTFLAISVLLLTTSCSDDIDDNINLEATTSENFYGLFQAEITNQTQTFSFDSESGLVTFISDKGVYLTIDGSCLRKNGQPVTGQVDLEFIEIFDRSTMLLTNKLTMGLDNGQKKLLISGGEFYINVRQDNVSLTLTCEMSLAVPTALTGGTAPEMAPFKGTVDTNGSIMWELSPMTELWNGTLNPSSNEPSYNALISNFGWFNCDYFMNSNLPMTEITANVPAGYGYGNSIILLVTRNIQNSLGTIGGVYPIGLDCHLIFLSEKDGKFYYSIKENQTLINNHVVNFSLSEIQLATAEEMRTIIDALD